MKNKNNIAIKLVGAVLVGTIAVTSFTGCNKTILDTKYKFDTAVIVNDNVATIVEIKKWKDYEGEQLQIETKDGLVIITSSFDTKLLNTKDSSISAEDFAKTLVGENGEVHYYDEDLSKNNVKIK